MPEEHASLSSDQHTPVKETSAFSLSADYYNSLVYFELSTNDRARLDESNIKQTLTSVDQVQALIQNVYILYGQRSLLVVAKHNEVCDQLGELIVKLLASEYEIKRTSIPNVCNSVPPLLLACEITDAQLRMLNSDDKNTALKKIEASTGLKLKKVKKTFYFTGLLFQFLILNELFREATSKKETIASEPCQAVDECRAIINPEMPRTKSNHLDWNTLYADSKISGHFRLKPKQKGSQEILYDIYIFEADLTDLNTDGLVNAANPNLHPGYTGDGISRRIREKAGKQMQDACKRIIRQDRNNELVQEGEVCIWMFYRNDRR
jgi:hypothetical protein